MMATSIVTLSNNRKVSSSMQSATRTSGITLCKPRYCACSDYAIIVLLVESI